MLVTLCSVLCTGYMLSNPNFSPRNFSFDDAHCEGARVIAQAAREAGVKRLIHVSALNASEESPSKFLQSKVLKEEVICFLCNLILFELLVIQTSPYMYVLLYCNLHLSI